FQEITLPAMSVMVTIVLLKEACTCTSPCGTCLRSFFLKVFFLPFLSGAAAPPAAAGFAIIEIVLGPLSSLFALAFQPPKRNGEGWVLSLGRRLLLLGDCAFARSLAGTRIGMGTLPADRQVP